MWLILFALTPCTVKAAFLDSLEVAYQKPLNQSKTTVANSCPYAFETLRTVSHSKEVKVVDGAKQVGFLNKNLARPTTPTKKFKEDNLSNSPPKYILYKQLKISALT